MRPRPPLITRSSSGPPPRRTAGVTLCAPRHASSRLALLLLAAGALAGCEDAPAHWPDFMIGADAAWNRSPASPAEVGYTIAVLLLQRYHGDSCRPAPESTTFLVDGQSIPLTRDPASGCIEGEAIVGPFREEKAVAVRVEEDGRLVGEVLFEGLVPGLAATLVSP